MPLPSYLINYVHRPVPLTSILIIQYM